MKKEINLASKKYVDDNLTIHSLKPVKGSALDYLGTHVTGTVTFDGSASTKKTDEAQIKEWALLMGNSYGTNVMFDVIFVADGTYRISGYMYNKSGYGCVVKTSTDGVTWYRRYENAWL